MRVVELGISQLSAGRPLVLLVVKDHTQVHHHQVHALHVPQENFNRSLGQHSACRVAQDHTAQVQGCLRQRLVLPEAIAQEVLALQGRAPKACILLLQPVCALTARQAPFSRTAAQPLACCVWLGLTARHQARNRLLRALRAAIVLVVQSSLVCAQQGSTPSPCRIRV